MAHFDVSVPTLALVLRHIAALLDAEIEDVIIGRGEAAQEARPLYCWLARHVTDAAPEAIGFAVCIDRDAYDDMCAAVDLRRLSDKAYRERLDDVALEIHVEAGLVKRRMVEGVPDRDAVTTARRLLAGPRIGMSIPTPDLVHLAASYHLLLGKVRALDHATRQVQAAQYSPGERAARQACERATRDLIASLPHFSRKEPVRG